MTEKSKEYKEGQKDGFWEGVTVTLGVIFTAFAAIIAKSKTLK